MMAVADSGYAYLMAAETYATGSMIDLGWYFAPALLAFASLAPGATSSTASTCTRAAWI